MIWTKGHRNTDGMPMTFPIALIPKVLLDTVCDHHQGVSGLFSSPVFPRIRLGTISHLRGISCGHHLQSRISAHLEGWWTSQSQAV